MLITQFWDESQGEAELIRIGYACMNNSIGCTSASTFRLSSWSEKRFRETVMQNLDCLKSILKWNVRHRIYFFRITSDLVPFASHPICSVDWQEVFSEEFARVGEFLREHNIRVSMHPGQYTVLNSNRDDVVERSVLELEYHAEVLDLMGQDRKAKTVLHVGGVYGNKKKAMDRFVRNYKQLSERVRRRLIIENDERSYTVADCMKIHDVVGIPVVLDNLHHDANNGGESLSSAFEMARSTWKSYDGVPIIHYSSQASGNRLGKHALSIDLEDFRSVLNTLREHEFDLMLEVKDKENSAIKALTAAEQMDLLNQ
jgi:UV DNA damage endonuclease